MGTWGYRLFQDDCALDIRGEFRDHIGDGLTTAQALRKLRKLWNPIRTDRQDYAVFWLAVATTAWDLGRLTPDVLKRALVVLDRGIGLEAWQHAGAAAVEKRRKMYTSLRRQLTRRQPKPKHVPRRLRSTTSWKAGHLVSYRCLSNRLIYLRVLQIPSDRGGQYVWVDIMRWNRSRPPTRREAIRAKKRVERNPLRSFLNHSTMFLYGDPRRYPPKDRVEVLETGLRFRFRDGPGGTVFGGWKHLDSYLKREFSIQ